ncbi:MAG TPA: CAP domain-containing protein [Xanthobacteraceae bacterium]|nr:CAP domain-containing protein [Xanthobacteraceae bacterium]
MRTAPFRPLASALIAALLLAGCGTTEAVQTSTKPSFYDNLAKGGTVDAAAAAAMISDYRRGKGLPAVEIDPVLMAVAERQAKAMATADKLSHDIGGRSFMARLKSAGFDGLRAAENVGAGYHTLAEAFSGWRDSPSHNRNMLLAGATRMGIAAAAAPNSKYKVFWAFVIGVPNPTVSIPPATDAPAPGETTTTLNGLPLPR